MLRYTIRRLMWALPTLLGVSLLVFAIAHIMPGDPASVLLPEDASQEDRDKVVALLGLDKPLPVQFGIWLANAVRGDLGTSIGMRAPVGQLLGDAFGNTMILALAAAIIGIVVGGTLGTVAALRRGTWIDKLVSAIGLSGISLPAFWLAFLLIVIFSVQLSLLSYGGGDFADRLAHLIMPAIAVSISTVGMMARMVRANLLQVLGEEFVVTLHAKGMSKGTVYQHVFRNVLAPILTVIGLEVGSLLGGSVLVETIFNWPGIGSLLNLAIGQRDIPLIQGGILIIAIVFVVVNLLVDLLHARVDPRIQRF